MMDLAAVLSMPISLAGFLAAGLAMHRTSRDALGAPTGDQARMRLRVAAAGAFVVAFGIALSGGMVALVGGFMLLFASAAVSLAVFTWRPRWAATLLKVAAVVGMVCVALAVARLVVG